MQHELAGGPGTSRARHEVEADPRLLGRESGSPASQAASARAARAGQISCGSSSRSAMNSASSSRSSAPASPRRLRTRAIATSGHTRCLRESRRSRARPWQSRPPRRTDPRRRALSAVSVRMHCAHKVRSWVWANRSPSKLWRNASVGSRTDGVEVDEVCPRPRRGLVEPGSLARLKASSSIGRPSRSPAAMCVTPTVVRRWMLVSSSSKPPRARDRATTASAASVSSRSM